jgi:hypothetical protein
MGEMKEGDKYMKGIKKEKIARRFFRKSKRGMIKRWTNKREMQGKGRSEGRS